MADAALEANKKKRTVVINILDQFETYIEGYDTTKECIEQLEVRIEKIQELWNSFDNIQTDIEVAATTDEGIFRTQFGDKYYTCVGKARKLWKEHDRINRNVDMPERSISEIPTDADSIRLPKYDLPKFEGSYETWLGFYDAFKTVIHDRSNISDIQKLQYLRSCLKGEAANVIKSLDTSADSYSEAWDLLIERYNNKRVIVLNHLKALLEHPQVTKDSAQSVRQFLDCINSHTRALKTLDQKIDACDSLFIYLMTAKLDKSSHQEWEKSIPGSEIPTIQQFTEFLNRRCRILEATTSNVTSQRAQSDNKNSHSKPQHAYVGTQPVNTCPICNENHPTYLCDTLLKNNTEQRYEMVKKARLCTNCLRKGHGNKECRSSGCKICNKKHNSILHHGSAPAEIATKSTAKPSTVCHVYNASEVLLSTARVNILDYQGKAIDCRILLDPGSQSNFMTESLAIKLGLKRTSVNIPIIAINQLETRLKHSVTAEIQSQHTQFNAKLSFLVLPKVTGSLPAQQIQRNELQIARNIRLADPQFHKPAEIDALIGGELFYPLLCQGQKKLNNLGAVLQKTLLGWIIAGKFIESQQQGQTKTCLLTLDQRIEDFWKMEHLPDIPQLSVEEQACEDHFIKNTTRDSTGRFIVKLPFNDKKSMLESGFDLALKRFYATERMLKKNPAKREQYVQFLRQYEDLGHMTLAVYPNIFEGFYLPHHGVDKEDSITTQLRVVLDGSAEGKNKLSLNKTQMVGPTIQDCIYILLTRARFYKYLITTDIEKMYRQTLIHEDDRIYQKILWREDSSQPIKTYTLNTVTYGTASAPFLATRSLQELAKQDGENYPLAAKALLNDVYVDNFLTGANTFDEACALRDQLIALTKRGGLNLRQWASNEKDILKIFKTEQKQDALKVLDTSSTIKTLGIYWNAESDEIGYKVKVANNSKKNTKRTILSDIASLFDPLGLLGPVIVNAKIIMQDIWKAELDWDESIPLHINNAWNQFRDQLHILNELQFPRKIGIDNASEYQLHGFCDSSEKAYGACIYIRSIKNQDVEIQLLCAKSRVAPLKTISLPRLELCAAHLLAKLYQETVKSLKINFNKTVFWSDSTITLHWINTAANKLKTFVANRVAKIQTLTNEKDWRHVPTADNPADFISRGQSPKEFLQNCLWKNGPNWLATAENTWPSFDLKPVEIPEIRAQVTLTVANVKPAIDFTRYSSINKLIRVIAYCLRFINIKCKGKQINSPLTIQELQEAHTRIIKLTQAEFSKKVKTLKSGKSLETSSKLLRLSPIIDNDGVLRVGGRLENADLPYSQKHPILLPKNHHITHLIIKNTHLSSWHAGTQGTLSAVRSRYWPIDGTNAVRQIIHNCITCFRTKPRESNYLMGNLPKDRLQITRPFTVVGVDYCGPFLAKEKKLRNRNKVKVYIAIFVCFSTKAVHIEVVSDLTTEAFLAAFQRFCSRRGKPTTVYSDNGSNFIGAKREIKELEALIRSQSHNKLIINQLSQQSITWHLNPPRSPHFGGIWEASVKSFKHHFIRTIGNALFTYEQLNTYAIEIEAILNSRPLTQLSSDPNDLQPLTPSHFLIGGLLNYVSEHDFTETASNRLSDWDHVTKIKQHFWKRWQKEYINQLNTRSKWQKNISTTVKIGTMVLLKDDNLPPLQWKIGRIIQLHPGNDNVIRVVTIKTATGEFTRSVKCICVLPITDS